MSEGEKDPNPAPLDSEEKLVDPSVGSNAGGNVPAASDDEESSSNDTRSKDSLSNREQAQTIEALTLATNTIPQVRQRTPKKKDGNSVGHIPRSGNTNNVKVDTPMRSSSPSSKSETTLPKASVHDNARMSDTRFITYHVILGVLIGCMLGFLLVATLPRDTTSRTDKTKGHYIPIQRHTKQEEIEEFLDEEDQEEEDDNEEELDQAENLRQIWRSASDLSYPMPRVPVRSKPSSQHHAVENKKELRERHQITSNPLKFYITSSHEEEKDILTPRDISVLSLTNTSCDDEDCKTSTLDWVSSKNRVLAIVEGYSMARLLCVEASKSIGWHISRATTTTTMAMAKGPVSAKNRKSKSQVSQTTERFHNPLYLSSVSIYGPYYCINLPLSETLLARGSSSSSLLSSPTSLIGNTYGDFKNRVGTKRTRKELEKQQARQLKQNSLGLTGFYKSWHSLVEGNSAVSYTTSKSDSFVTSVIHNSVVMGFLNEYVVMRNLIALGDSSNPKLQVSLVPYTSIIDALRLILDGHAQILQRFKSMNAHSVCMCGPHINMAHHVVGYANARRKRAVVYFEPIIVSPPPSPDDEKTVTYDLDEALFPWSWNLLDTMEFDKTSTHYENDPTLNELKQSLAGNEVTNEMKSYVSYAVADALLRRKVLPETTQTLVVQPKITVEYMRVDKGEGQTYYEEGEDSAEREDSDSVLYHEHVHDGKRTVTEVDGQEALCIQYCQQIAYSLTGYAEKQFDTILSTIETKLSESSQSAQDTPVPAEPKRGAPSKQTRQRSP